MRGLDEAQNPYRGKYEDWDRWAWEHRTDLAMLDPTAWSMQAVPPEQVLIDVDIDAAGYPVPLRESQQRMLAEVHAADAPVKQGCVLSFIAYGLMPQELRERLRRAELGERLRYLQPIPQWLATDPPQWALVLPDGRAVTRGMLGSGAGVDTCYTTSNEWNLPPQPYCLYSAAGQLLGKLPQGDADWYKLCWPGQAQALAPYRQAGAMISFARGCVYVRAYPSRQLEAVFSANGARLAGEEDWRTQPTSPWRGLYGVDIPAAYELQQANTPAAATSGK